MKLTQAIMAVAFSAGIALPAAASTSTPAALVSSLASTDLDAGSGVVSGTGPTVAGKLECVPYARVTSGIRIYGDAYTWWGQARGRYATGNRPRVGAVMAVRPFNNSRLGHVATVSRLVDSRTILLSHANWSIPGGIERNVTALDVSPANDWSQVRIWYAPSRGLGTTHWPVAGFIYNAKAGSQPGAADRADVPVRLANYEQPSSRKSSSGQASPGKPASRPGHHRDPIGAIIAGKY
jgi:surface antigen